MALEVEATAADNLAVVGSENWKTKIKEIKKENLSLSCY